MRRANLINASSPTQFAHVAQGRKNPLWMGLPERLKRTRKTAGLSMGQVAVRAKCSNPVVGAIERRGQVPGVDIVEKLASGLGVSPAWLGFGHQADLPFRQKQIRLRYQDPEPRPGGKVFRHLFGGCGERLRQVREQLGLSLRSVAEAAHVSYQAVLNIETGATAPKVDTLEAIAVALDVAPGWLAYGEDYEESAN